MLLEIVRGEHSSVSRPHGTGWVRLGTGKRSIAVGIVCTPTSAVETQVESRVIQLELEIMSTSVVDTEFMVVDAEFMVVDTELMVVAGGSLFDAS